MTPFREIAGNVVAPQGFTAAAMHCGIKPTGARDLVLIRSDATAAAAVTLTTNRFRAAPTYVTEAAVANGAAQAIVANSGNANCATGSQGLANAYRMAAAAAAATGVPPEDVTVASTGPIGVQLPIEKIEQGIRRLGKMLGRDDPDVIPTGIMTTDRWPKHIAVEFDLEGVTVRLGAICKGAGMICPQMATMLCFLTTDLAIDPGVLRGCLRRAVGVSFNCISVDGDMSTNDTVAILANGAAGNRPLLSPEDPQARTFQAALDHCCWEMARQIVANGEGMTKVIEVRVTGAASYKDAHAVARRVGNYLEVKAALFWEQLNWGRICAAVGAAGVPVDPATTTIHFAGTKVWERGEPVEFDGDRAQAALKQQEVQIAIDLGAGEDMATAWASDLTPEYVQLNKV